MLKRELLLNRRPHCEPLEGRRLLAGEPWGAIPHLIHQDAAAVQFPLAEVGDLEQGLGSRHRAAVGLSQETDAVVVVISEQTGDISVAERGVLTRKITPERLRDLLGELLGKNEARPFRKAAA